MREIMRVVNTTKVPESFSVDNFGASMQFEILDDADIEQFLTLLMKAFVFERRVKEAGYPLIEESVWSVILEY